MIIQEHSKSQNLSTKISPETLTLTVKCYHSYGSIFTNIGISHWLLLGYFPEAHPQKDPISLDKSTGMWQQQGGGANGGEWDSYFFFLF